MELIERLFTASSIGGKITFLAFVAATFIVYITIMRIVAKVAANIIKNIF